MSEPGRSGPVVVARRTGRAASPRYPDGVTSTGLQESFRRDALVYGQRLPVNPYRALLDEVQWRAGHVAWLREELQREGYDSLTVVDHQGNRVESVWLKRYDIERRHLDRACRLAIDAGIAERYVQLAELQGQTLYSSLRSALDQTFTELGLTAADQERFASVFGAAFRSALEAESRGPTRPPTVEVPALPPSQ